MADIESAPELESALGAAFGLEPKASAPVKPAAPPAAAPSAPEADAPMTPEEELLSLLPPDEDESEPKPEVEPAGIEIELDDGVKEVLPAARVKELLLKDKDYSRKTEEVSRTREAITAQHEVQNLRAAFQQYVAPEQTELQRLEWQAAPYETLDWNAAIQNSPIDEVARAQAQWNLLKSQIAAKKEQIHGKEEEFKRVKSEYDTKVLVAEHAALLAKLPGWRNSEKASADKQAIGKFLREIGYQDSEMNLLTDHRAMLAAHYAAKYFELLKTKESRVKQIRAAPPVNTPGASGQQQPGDKAEYARFVKGFKTMGQRGDHLSQEKALVNLFGRTFKSKGS